MTWQRYTPYRQEMGYNYDLFLALTRDVPHGLDLSIKKESVTKEIRELLAKRDNNTCQCCGLKDRYGNPGWDNGCGIVRYDFSLIDCQMEVGIYIPG